MTETVNPRALISKVAEQNPTVPELQFIRDDPEGIEITLLEGGMVNYVYRVLSHDKNCSVIIKYAEEAMRLAPEEKLSLDRQQLEYDALKLFDSIQSGSVPTPFLLDTTNHVIAIEDLSEWELLGDQLLKEHVDLGAAGHLGHLLGKFHQKTSHSCVPDQQWQDLRSKFTQQVFKNNERFKAFEVPYIENHPLTKVPEDMQTLHQKYVGDIKAKGLQKKIFDLYDQQICVIHGDCHHRAVFVKQGLVKLFDFEYTFLGHPAFNLSFVVSGYLSEWILHKAHDQVVGDYMTAIQNLMEAYLEQHSELTKDEKTMVSFLSEVALFTGGSLFMMSVHPMLDYMPGIQKGDRSVIMERAFQIMISHENIDSLYQFLTYLRG